jgi:purine catabolism regulator
VKWISARKPDRETLVRWVSLDVDGFRSGDAILIPAEKLSKDLIDAAEKGGAAAILVQGRVRSTSAVTRSPIPILALPPDRDLEGMRRILLTALIGQRGNLTEWGGGIHQQLERIVAEGEGLQGLARAMAEISGRGVLVQDKRLRVLASEPSAEVGEVWDELLTDLGDPGRLPESIRDRKEAGKGSYFIDQTLPGGLARLVAPVIVAEVARGYLSLVGLDGDLDAMDRTVAEQGVLACAVQMSRSKAIRETEKRLRGDLLTALLQGDLSPRDARLWAEAMGVDLSHAHTAIRFAWDGEAAPSLRRLETLVHGEIARMGLSVIEDTLGSEVICFCQVEPESGVPKAPILFGQAVLDAARAENSRGVARCGIGSPARELSAWHNSFRHAGQALELAGRLAAARPLYFPDLSVYRLLMQLEDSQELKAFEFETLGRLAEYESGEELLRTLQAYFDHNGNLTQTADALYIHRNSLIYRMDRIADITGLDLDNPETRLAIQLALHINRMAK